MLERVLIRSLRNSQKTPKMLFRNAQNIWFDLTVAWKPFYEMIPVTKLWFKQFSRLSLAFHVTQKFAKKTKNVIFEHSEHLCLTTRKLQIYFSKFSSSKTFDLNSPKLCLGFQENGFNLSIKKFQKIQKYCLGNFEHSFFVLQITSKLS